jgi:phosphoglycolate phosphatase-like HAD superfamily hydrolase
LLSGTTELFHRSKFGCKAEVLCYEYFLSSHPWKRPKKKGACMNFHRRIPKWFGAVAAVWIVLLSGYACAQTSPLPSWNDGASKQAIISFVKQVTDKSDAKYVDPDDRIATFDQDGTLWVEHPLYTQAMFALARVHELAPQHPEWKQREPFKAVLADDREAMAKFDESDWGAIVAATHAGMTTAAFESIVRDWLASAKDPRFHRPYTELVYRPMLEVMDFLRANGFKTYIVTGGGQEFVRVYSQRVYGIPPEQVVGSSILTKYEYQDGKPVLMREPKIFFNDNYGGKAVGINLFIGKRPYAAFGNSTGDQQMLEWTQAGDGARLMMLVLHDDPMREYAYGPANGLPDSKVGTFSDALMDEAKKKGWVVISMKNDWKRIFDFEK